MPVPQTVYPPPFNITRASHAVLTVRDLAASRAFYVDFLGLVVSDEEEDVLYLRGVAEACHHSLVLKRSGDHPVCERIGLRVFTDDDLEQAKRYFEAAGLLVQWVDVPYQGRTLHASDPLGTPLELCAVMPARPRLDMAFELHRGANALRLDHVQMQVPDVRRACEFYTELGFRLSEYISPDGTDELVTAFLQRKGNPHDVVFDTGPGPRFHHAAFVVLESFHLVQACDLASSLGYATNVEWGPGRHGPGHALFVYLRDPDGHRVELFNTHYLMIDLENEPVRWDVSVATRRRWQLPAQRRWFTEASLFAGVDPREPARRTDPPTLQRYLAEPEKTSA